MNKAELKKELKRLNINPSYYSIDGGPLLDSQVVLDYSLNYYSDNKKYGEWQVFFMERGIKYEKKIYYTEEEAVKDVLERVIKFQ